MSDIFDLLKNVWSVIQSIFDYIVSGIKGGIELLSIADDLYATVYESVALMPPVVIPFMSATVFVIILYFVLSLVTG